MYVYDFIERNGNSFWSTNYDPGGYNTRANRYKKNPFLKRQPKEHLINRICRCPDMKEFKELIKKERGDNV